jgi:multiple sugar transport system ATP-binding protein
VIGTVDLIEALGSELMVHFTTDARRVRAEGALDPTEQAGEGVARVAPGSPVTVGQQATFAIRTEGMQFFDADSGDAIWGV